MRAAAVGKRAGRLEMARGLWEVGRGVPQQALVGRTAQLTCCREEGLSRQQLGGLAGMAPGGR